MQCGSDTPFPVPHVTIREFVSNELTKNLSIVLQNLYKATENATLNLNTGGFTQTFSSVDRR